jgi:hypothetical protein
MAKTVSAIDPDTNFGNLNQTWMAHFGCTIDMLIKSNL